MRARLSGPPPEQAGDYAAVLERVVADVLPYASRTDHPGYFAFVPSFTTWPAALAELTAAAANPYCGAWMESAAASQIELEVIDWFRGWLGMPASTAGLLVTGGSAANLTALLVAREAAGGPADDSVIYVSDQAHSSLARTARAMGLRSQQVRVLPTDDHWRLAPGTVAAAIRADRQAGLAPFAVCASGGSTNTGAVDPLGELADVCAGAGVWLHVDAAYGGFAALTPKGRAALAGIDRADSVTLDPHKWLFQPMECGSVLIRDGARLERTFAIHPDYLDDNDSGDGEVNFADRGLQLSRGFRALKVWMSVQTFGLAAFRAAIQRNLDLAEFAEDPGPPARRAHADGTGGTRHHLLPPGLARLRRGRDGAPRAGPRRGSRAQRRRARVQHPPGGPPRHPALHPQPHQLRGGHSAGHRALRQCAGAPAGPVPAGVAAAPAAPGAGSAPGGAADARASATAPPGHDALRAVPLLSGVAAEVLQTVRGRAVYLDIGSRGGRYPPVGCGPVLLHHPVRALRRVHRRPADPLPRSW